MSAQLASTNSFSAHLALAAGVSVSISAPTLDDLSKVVARVQGTAANDTAAVPAPTTGKSKPAATPAPAAATAPAGPSASTTAASSAPAAAAQAAQGDAGNATQGGQTAAASTASSEKPAAAVEVTFDVLKKAFLALSTKADGRAKCENVLKPFNLAKLSEAKPEQYAAVLAAIEEASK